MNKLNFESTGGPCGDATSSYNITFPKGMTVKQFIETVLQERADSWGEFRLGSRIGQLLLTYDRGDVDNIFCDNIDEYYTKIVLRVEANGGWGNMDYYLVLGDPEPDAIVTYDNNDYWGHWLICQKCGSKSTPAYGQYCCECGHKFETKHYETSKEWQERY